MMGAFKQLDGAPTWAQELFNEFQALREEVAQARAENRPASLTVGTAEAAIMLDKQPRTIREWYKLGKMPKPVSKANENLAWERSAIEKMCSSKAKGGRPRNNA